MTRELSKAINVLVALVRFRADVPDDVKGAISDVDDAALFEGRDDADEAELAYLESREPDEDPDDVADRVARGLDAP